MMRVDYRWLRLVSVPALPARDRPARPRLRAGAQTASSAARRAGSQIGPLPAVHPAEFAKLGPHHLPRPLAREPRRPRSASSGRARSRSCVISVPVVAARLQGAGPRARRSVIAITGVHDVLRRRRQPRSTSARWAALGVVGVVAVHAPTATSSSGSGPGSNPWRDPLGAGFHTIQGLLALGLGGIFGAGLGESQLAGGLFLPNASNDFIFAIIGEEFGLVGAGIVIALFVLLGLRRRPDRARARRTRSAPCWPRGSRPGCASRRSSTSRSWWR